MVNRRIVVLMERDAMMVFSRHALLIGHRNDPPMCKMGIAGTMINYYVTVIRFNNIVNL